LQIGGNAMHICGEWLTLAALHGLGMKKRDGTSTGESRSPAAAGTTE